MFENSFLQSMYPLILYQYLTMMHSHHLYLIPLEENLLKLRNMSTLVVNDFIHKIIKLKQTVELFPGPYFFENQLVLQ